MSNDWRREVEQELAAFDDEDRALLEHVFGDDRPPQGLHQHGFKPFGEPTREEDEWADDYLYPSSGE